MAKRGSAKSLVDDIYQRVRQDIFDGRLRPGERLQPSVLGQRYNASTTVVREALTTLIGDRLVASRTGQGFFIPSLDRGELRDITTVRCHTEALALRLALERGDVGWESDLIAAHHRLSRTPRREPDNPEHLSPAWSSAHRAFHNKLIEACGVPVLLDMCHQMAASTALYRVWSAPFHQSTTRDVESEHAAILEAALDRDVTRATALLVQHYEATAKLVLEHWREGASTPGASTTM